jgi:phage terminase large subunit
MPKLAKDRPKQIEITAPRELFNPCYYPYVNLIERYEVYYGGASSGKSYFIADKLVLQLSTRANRNLVLVRHTLTACTTSCWNQIKQSIRKFHLESIWQMNDSNYSMTCIAPGYVADGNMIVCRGMDDVEKIKSITFPNGNVTDIWYEEASEELELGNMIVLDQRLRGGNEQKRLIVSFNPIFYEHWLRTWIDKTLRDRRCIVLRTTYKDNLYLSDDDRNALEQYKDSDPYRYQVYCLGEWGVQGQTIFNANKINERKQTLENRYREQPPRNVRFQYEMDGSRVKRGSISVCEVPRLGVGDDYCYLYRDVNPTHPYVVVVDTAGDGSDYYAAHVFDNATQEQCMVFHSSEQVDECAMQVYCMGKHYNNALMVIEVNFDQYPTRKMQELGYTNLYTRETSPDVIAAGYVGNTGYRTHSGNRQMMISALVEWVNKGGCSHLNDIGTLSEMLTFVLKFKKRNGQNVPTRAEAANGAHDDLVMSLAIYLMSKDQQTDELVVEKGLLEGFYFPSELEDMVQSKRITKAEMNRYLRDHARKEVSF